MQKDDKMTNFLLTSINDGGKLEEISSTQHVEENQYTPIPLCQRAAGCCEAVEASVWNSFRSGFTEIFGE